MSDAQRGELITLTPDGGLDVPDRPVIPFIEGDGIGRDIWPATRQVVEAAVGKAYGGSKAIV